jgi:hypothetical protein
LLRSRFHGLESGFGKAELGLKLIVDGLLCDGLFDAHGACPFLL